MLNAIKSALIGTIWTVAAAGMAWADENMVPLAASGEWVAVAHHASMVSPPDVCMAISQRDLALRADANNVELRVLNEKWSLPTDVQGTITVSVGTWAITQDITENTSNMVTTVMGNDDLIAMFAAMDKAAAMAVTVGKAPPLAISLVGSTKVTDAFRTCAGIKSNSKAPGSNPFE